MLLIEFLHPQVTLNNSMIFKFGLIWASIHSRQHTQIINPIEESVCIDKIINAKFDHSLTNTKFKLKNTQYLKKLN